MNEHLLRKAFLIVLTGDINSIHLFVVLTEDVICTGIEKEEEEEEEVGEEEEIGEEEEEEDEVGEEEEIGEEVEKEVDVKGEF